MEIRLDSGPSIAFVILEASTTKAKMKYSTRKIPPAKMNSSADKALVKSPKLRKSQQKPEGVCQMYFMQLRSGLIIEKTSCYFRKEITKRYSPRTAEKCRKQCLVFTACHQQLNKDFTSDVPMLQKCFGRANVPSIQEYSASLSTYNDQSITFVFEDGSYEIYVEDLRKGQEKGDDVDGQTLLVNLSPTKDKDFLLHANNEEHSVELQKCENQLPDQAFFLLHRKSSECVSFECKNNPGVFIGVKDNHLALIKVGDQTKDSYIEKTIFKLS